MTDAIIIFLIWSLGFCTEYSTYAQARQELRKSKGSMLLALSLWFLWPFFSLFAKDKPDD